jgi:hypothetical protein
MRYSKITIIVVVVVVLVLVLVAYNKKELFNNYDYIYEGDLILDKGNIGIGKEPESDKKLIVDGTLHVEDELCLGDACFDYDTVKKLNDLPVFQKDKLCLKDPSGEICINEDHLKIITGEKNVIFKNNYGGAIQPFHFSRHGGHHDDSDLSHDDESDGKPNGGLVSTITWKPVDAIISSINPVITPPGWPGSRYRNGWGGNKDINGKLITGETKEYSIMPESIKNEEVKWNTITNTKKVIMKWVSYKRFLRSRKWYKRYFPDTIKWIYTKHEKDDEPGYLWITYTSGNFYRCKKPCTSGDDFKQLLGITPLSSLDSRRKMDIIDTMAIVNYNTEYYIYAVSDTNKHFIINTNDLYEIIKDVKPEAGDYKWKQVISDKKFSKLTSLGEHLYGLGTDGYVFKANVSPIFKKCNKYTYWAKYSKSLSGSPWKTPDKYIHESIFSFKNIYIHDKTVFVLCDLLGYYPRNTIYQDNIKLDNLIFEFDINDISQDFSKFTGGTNNPFKWVKYPHNITPDGTVYDVKQKIPHIQVIDLCIGSSYVYITDIKHQIYQQSISSFKTDRFKQSLILKSDSSMTLFTKKYLTTNIIEHNGILWLLSKNYELYKYTSITKGSLLDLGELSDFKKTGYKGKLVVQDKKIKKIYVDYCNNLIGVDIYNTPHVYGDFINCKKNSTAANVNSNKEWASLESDLGRIVTIKNNIKYGIIDNNLIRKMNGQIEVIDTDIKYIAPLINTLGNYIWCIKNDNHLYQYSLSIEFEDVISWDKTDHIKSKDISISIDNDIWSLTSNSIYKNDKPITDGVNKGILANVEDNIYRIDNNKTLLKCEKPCNYDKWTEVEIEKANSDTFQSDKNSLYFLKDNQIKYKNMLNVTDGFDYKCFQGKT